MTSHLDDIEALKISNQLFYDAFGSLDISEMDAVCEQSTRALCIHRDGNPSWGGTISGDPGKASSTAPP